MALSIVTKTCWSAAGIGPYLTDVLVALSIRQIRIVYHGRDRLLAPGAWRISPNRHSGAIRNGIEWVEGFLSADALAVRTLRQHSQPGRFDVPNARRSQAQTEQGLAQRRVPWPVTISMSRTGSRSCAMMRAPSLTAWRLPCRRRPARRLRLAP